MIPDNDVTGYPTLKFFKKDSDEAAEKYRGGRDLPNLVKFINKKLGVESEEEEVSSIPRRFLSIWRENSPSPPPSTRTGFLFCFFPLCAPRNAFHL